MLVAMLPAPMTLWTISYILCTFNGNVNLFKNLVSFVAIHEQHCSG